METVMVNWSGGKDSTAAIIKYKEAQKYKIKARIYIPYFNKKTPLISKEQFNFIKKTIEIFKTWGIKVYIAKGITYKDLVLHEITKGKNKGKVMGFPIPHAQCCDFKNYSKIKAIKKVKTKYDFEDIGIAYDETKRKNQLNNKTRSILNELKITEKEAFEICKTYNLISPHYKEEKRDGCALCPNANAKRREKWYNDYPNAKKELNKLEKIIYIKRKERNPLRNGKWFTL